MYIIEVIPLILLPSNVPQILSYFYESSLERGSLVEVAINHRKVNAVVISSSALEEKKFGLKKSDFQLKRLGKIILSHPQVSRIQFQITLWLSKNYYAPLGYCLKTVLSRFILRKTQLINRGSSILNLQSELEKKSGPSLLILTKAKNTLENLNSKIKEATKDNGQVLIIVPDVATIDYFYNALSKDYKIQKITSSLSNKKLYKIWQSISSGKTQIIIGTRQSLFLPFNNLKLIVLDDPLNIAYKSDMTPKYRTPDLVHEISKLYNIQLIICSPIEGIGYFHKSETGKIDIIDKKSGRPEINIVNTKLDFRFSKEHPISEDLRIKISEAVRKKERVLIFSPRRGYSGILACQNCNMPVKCPNCDTPMRIHKSIELMLICHHCQYNQKFPNYCANCNNYKLKAIGPVGTQKIYDEISEILTSKKLSAKILILDADVTKNETEEMEVIEEIKKQGPAILIATQMVFSYRYDLEFNLIGILNLESLVATPDFQSEENLLYQFEKIIDFDPKEILIQVYNPQSLILELIKSGDYKEFYISELKSREALSYPPFSRFVKLTYKHRSQQRASYQARLLNEKLKMAIIHSKLNDLVKMIEASPAYIEKERGFYIYNIILKILPKLENPKEILKFVPNGWAIDIDPLQVI